MTHERRRRRSHDPLVALHYQLSDVRTEASLDTLVVADACGMVIAGAGSWPSCEELAAYAPIFMGESAHGASDRVRELQSAVSVRKVPFGEGSLFVVAKSRRDECARAAHVGRAVTGTLRILSV